MPATTPHMHSTWIAAAGVPSRPLALTAALNRALLAIVVTGIGLTAPAACVSPEKSSPATRNARASPALPAGGLGSPDEAISVSLQRFPSDHSYSDVFAHRVQLGELVEEWYAGGAFPDWDLTETVWIVGMKGDSLTVDDILSPPGFLSENGGSFEPHRVAGAYYIWIARTGDLIGEGILNEPGGKWVWDTYDRLYAMGGYEAGDG